MSGGERLRAALVAGAGTDAGARVRQDAADQEDAYPFIIFRRVEVDRLRGLDGSLHATKEIFHVECWGETRDQSDAIEAQALALLQTAGLYADGNEPDGLDPEVKVRAAVFELVIWTAASL